MATKSENVTEGKLSKAFHGLLDGFVGSDGMGWYNPPKIEPLSRPLGNSTYH